MKSIRKTWPLAGLTVALSLAGCGGSSNDSSVASNGTSVPDSAGTSGAAFVSFMATMSVTDETSEPLTINDSLAVPPDDQSEPQLLT
jgi:hypothetical protein